MAPKKIYARPAVTSERVTVRHFFATGLVHQRDNPDYN